MRAAASGAEFEITDPATGDVVATMADAGPEDTRAALDAASAAFPGWAATPPRQRSEILRRAYEIMISEVDALAAVITLENGKALAAAAAEVAYAAAFFRWFAEEAVRTDGEYGESPAGRTRAIVMSRPVGVAALVSPWNFPAAMATRKIAPALAAGCTALLKPAAMTPLTARAIADVVERAGAPAGVVATARPDGVVGTWLDDPRVRKLVLHRVDRGRPETAGAGRRPGGERVHGAGWQRAVRGARR